MAVSLGSSGWAALGESADPSGTMTADSGSDRLMVAVSVALRNSYTVSAFAVNGSSYTDVAEYIETSSSPDHIIRFHWWTEADIDSGAVTYTDDVAAPAKFSWTYATFTGVNQSSPTLNFTAYSASTDALAVTTTSTSSDQIIVASGRNNANRLHSSWSSLTEFFDQSPASGMNFGLASGPGGENSKLVTGDGTLGSMALSSLVLKAADSAGSASLLSSSGRGIMRGVARGIC